MSSEIAIKVEGLSKCYHIYERPRDRLKQFVLPRMRRLFRLTPKQYYREFWALKDVAFEVKKGETLGIIGRNGSGKSTLLQMICGTLNPSSGIVNTEGRIAALLELGSGFNPEFTGRENVYMNASVLGLSKEETDARFDEIVAFADIGEFIDQPVKTYSSGMLVRLAFAVQAQTSPDVLIVDEALAVGDVKFQAKCFERLRQLKEQGTSILLVTHSTEQIVSHCSEAILLEQGGVIEFGHPRTVVNRYLDLLFGKPSIGGDTTLSETSAEISKPALAISPDLFAEVFATRPNYNSSEYRWGDRAATILDFVLSDGQKFFPVAVNSGSALQLWISIRFEREVFRPILGVTIKTREGVTVYGTNSEMLNVVGLKQAGIADSVLVSEVTLACRLAQGDYFISIGVASRGPDGIVPHDRRYDSVYLQVKPAQRFFGIVDLSGEMNAEVIRS